MIASVGMRNCGVTIVSRKYKHEFEQGVNDLLARGYSVEWQHKTLNIAKMRNPKLAKGIGED